jgi:tetratricopeptide (TPR) repeat protein
VWFFSEFQAEETRQRLAAEATLTAETLAAKEERADTFLRAGRPEQALDLYNEIQRTDPSYGDVNHAIEAAELAIRVEDLYQQGARAAANGANERALELLGQVEQLRPKYKDARQLIDKLAREQEIASLLEALNDAYSRSDSAGAGH